MWILLLTLGLPLVVWGSVALLRGSVYLTAALFLVATCCFPAEFLSIDAAGLTWTADRCCLLLILLQLALLWYRGELKLTRIESTDVAIGLFALWLIARSITQPLGSIIPGQPHTLMHLVNGYLIPIVLYVALRLSRLEQGAMKPALCLLLAMGAYLSLTAIMEVTQVWGLVFPRFIGDPELGIHFGRARGPMLQSVRLGIVLIACWVPFIIYTVWLDPQSRWRWSAVALATPIVFAATYFTYTRSTWMGLGFAVLCLTLLALRGLPRRAVLFGGLAASVLVGVIKGPDLVSFKREYTAAETRESTYMRAAFAYVSLEMFKDRPIAGFGFNQFQVHNRQYLSDRSTEIRLESIRGYVHHNGFLSILVDLGLVGLSLYAFVISSAVVQIIALWQAAAVPRWVRGLSLLTLAVGGAHMIQMAFHEVSFSSIENSLLFGSLALVVAANNQYCFRPKSEQINSSRNR